MTPRAAALAYARRGWAVLPCWWVERGRCACRKPVCAHPGNHPLAALAPNGVKSATTDPEAVQAWWGMFGRANLAVATGPVSGLLVLDIDPRHGGRPDRLPGPLPRTPVVRTGGGGWHLYLGHPEGSVKFLPKLPGCPGVDLKAAGGYVLAPPSVHASGRSYEWLVGPAAPLAPCPEWLVEAARRPEPRPRPPARVGGAAGTPYGRAALREELARLAQALTRKAVELALEGHPVALRLCLERLLPPRKERPVPLELPRVESTSDLPGALAAVLEAVGSGELAPAEGQALATLLDGYRKALEATDLDRRVTVLEQLAGLKGRRP